MCRFIVLIFFVLIFGSDIFAVEKPNIVLILADDLGYGDVSCYGATRVKTPNIDRLANEGIRFTDAHSVAATCTPSRFALISGIYPWRKSGTGILPGNAPLIIPPKSITLPSILKQAGYVNGVVGKWHLGLGTPQSPADWNGEIKPGPLEIGFDYSFIIPATGDRVPCVFVENHRVANLDPNDPIQVSYKEKIGAEPTGKERPDLLKQNLLPDHGHDQTIVNGISRIGYMSGGKSARWVDENIADTITAKACRFIEENKERSFFLYFATHDIHVPRVPHPRFVGKTPMGARGDVIVEFDWSVGEILQTLDRLKLADNTIVIVSSDNGPVVNDGYIDRAVDLIGDHKPAGLLRGGKSSAFEAGTRVPFIVRLPKKTKAGKVSDALISLIDIPATFAALTNQKIPETAIPDSENILPALIGETNQGRKNLVLAAHTQSLRHGTQKIILPNKKGRKITAHTHIETGNDPNPQLYDLKNDLGEKNNLAEKQPEQWNNLHKIFQEIRNKKIVIP
ncbi:MAG: arylsulfatase [Planctomycetaceae bacterium]|jgi:arylsulfatase A-like enzyme|nr:arylsulfatase [Planctomycetaceae bacterium]